MRNGPTVSRKIEARSASHIWDMQQEDFMQSRKELSHNKKATKKKKAAPDFSHLAGAMIGGEEHEQQFVVEAILQHKGGKAPKYQVKWKGAPSACLSVALS